MSADQPLGAALEDVKKMIASKIVQRDALIAEISELQATQRALENVLKHHLCEDTK